jgi:hypothetical protein
VTDQAAYAEARLTAIATTRAALSGDTEAFTALCPEGDDELLHFAAAAIWIASQAVYELADRERSTPDEWLDRLITSELMRAG